MHEGHLRLEGCAVDLDREEVHHSDGRTEHLSTKEAAVLRQLVAKAPAAVTRDALLEEVWGYRTSVVTRAVDNTVRRLRQKIERSPREPHHVLTVHGEGYRFVGPPRAAAPDPGPTFHGRAPELAMLDALAQRGVRWVTVLGPGGIGKTRLVREWTRSRAARTVELAATRDADDVLAALAASLGGAPGDEHAVAAAMARLGGTWVLDNCEQVEAAVAHLGSLLDRGVQVVATSRHRLGVPEEQVVRLGPLEEEAARELLVSRVVARGEVLADSPDLDALVARLQGWPLALELAAGRMALLGPRGLLERLDAALEVLGSERADAHATLRGTLAWSWSQLDGDERAVLAACGVFAGSFDAGAAEAVAPRGHRSVLDVLGGLRDKSLLEIEVREGRARLSLLDAVRQFARAQCPLNDAEERHARHYATPESGDEATERAQRIAAHRWALAHDPALAVELVDRLVPAFVAHGPARQWLAVTSATLHAAERADPASVARARLLDHDARIATGREPDLEGLVALVARCHELGEPKLQARAWLALARFRRSTSDPDGAREALSSALAVGATGAMEGLLQLERGNLAFEANDHTEARRAYRSALQAFESAGERTGADRVALHLAFVLGELGQHEEAVELGERALDRALASSDRRGEGVVRCHLALLALDRGQLARASAQLEEAGAAVREVGDRRFQGYVALLEAMVAQDRGAHRAMEQRARDAHALLSEAGDEVFAAFALARVGVAAALQHRPDEADAALAEAAVVLGTNPAWARGLDLLEGFNDLARGAREAARDRLHPGDTRAESTFVRIAHRQLAAAVRAGQHG